MKGFPLAAAGRVLRRLAGARCQACQGVFPSGGGEGSLCRDCRQLLPPLTDGYCPQCGLPFGGGAGRHACLECRHGKRPWRRFGVYGIYEGLLRDLLVSFKFRGELGHASLLQDLLARAYHRCLVDSPEGVVPVPLHPVRLRERGYNQSLELVRGLAGRLGVELLPKALHRTRQTRPQQGLSRRERMDNLHRAFAADATLVRGRHLLLVDDVYTTGSTIVQCARTLQTAGARQVDVLILARAR